jgi:hypothetical protein
MTVFLLQREKDGRRKREEEEGRGEEEMKEQEGEESKMCLQLRMWYDAESHNKVWVAVISGCWKGKWLLLFLVFIFLS